jgi:hypothetical protein
VFCALNSCVFEISIRNSGVEVTLGLTKESLADSMKRAAERVVLVALESLIVFVVNLELDAGNSNLGVLLIATTVESLDAD